MTDENVEDPSTHILRKIHDELRITNTRLDSLERTTQQGFERIDARFDRLETRFDRILVTAGKSTHAHETRLEALEGRVDALERGTPRRRRRPAPGPRRK